MLSSSDGKRVSKNTLVNYHRSGKTDIVTDALSRIRKEVDALTDSIVAQPVSSKNDLEYETNTV